MEADVNSRPLWRQLIWKGEMKMLGGCPQEAEQIYLMALAEAKELPAEDKGWVKMHANLRYLYLNFLCQRPVTPDDLFEHTVPRWSQALGPAHHFIFAWIKDIDDWRAQIASQENTTTCESHQEAAR